MGAALLYKGDAKAALAEFALEDVDEEIRVKGQAMALHDLDLQDEFETRLQELIKRWGDEWPSEVAQVYAYIGEPDIAFEWLEKSVTEKEIGGFDMQSPFFESLRSDPRWLPLLERAGRSPEQLGAIEFQVTLPGASIP
jgi:hypothetical protein